MYEYEYVSHESYNAQYIAIALFFTLVSGVNLTLDALASPKNATAISFDIIIVLFYAFSGLNGYFLWLFIRQN